MFAASILKLIYEDGQVQLDVSIIGLAVLFGLPLFLRFGSRRWFGHKWDIVELDVTLGGIGKAKIRRTDEVVRLAHQAWTELATRKAALPFDEDNDVIREVYDSWYVLFGELRRLTRSVPAEQIRNGGPSKELVDILVKALNDGLRPHLTRWQARFRAWERSASEAEPGRSPQDVQRDFPEYTELVESLKAVNGDLVAFASQLNGIVLGRNASG